MPPYLYLLGTRWPSYTPNHWIPFKVKVKLRPTVSRTVRLGARHTSGTRDQFFFLFEIFFRQLRVCYFEAPSLTRGRVCNLLLLLVLDSSVPLRSESSETQDHILLSQFLRLLNLEGYVLVFISPRNIRRSRDLYDTDQTENKEFTSYSVIACVCVRTEIVYRTVA
jgi:hypothetical protein